MSSLQKNRAIKKGEKSPGIHSIATNLTADKRITNLEKKSSSGQDIATWEALRLECDKEPYSVKWLDSVGRKITHSIAKLFLSSSYKEVQPLKSSVANIKYNNIRLTGSRYNKIYNLYYSTLSGINRSELELLVYANNIGLKAGSIEELRSNINLIKKSNAEKNVSKATGGKLSKFLGPVAKSIPVIGLGLDATIAAKNCYESWINGSKIVNDLPLQKYNIDKNLALLPSRENIKAISKKLYDLTVEFEDNPKNLFEILEISKTLKAYSTDFVSAILNGLMVILDIAEFTGLGALVSFILQVPLIAIEIANDNLVEEEYMKPVNYIIKVCDDKIKDYRNNSSLSFGHKEEADTTPIELSFGDKKEPLRWNS
jgi:hypothetical protein